MKPYHHAQIVEQTKDKKAATLSTQSIIPEGRKVNTPNRRWPVGRRVEYKQT